ncbi:hypothetical protein HYALB_00009501 [Hymenoscyphus albidus]|uniref:Uncharacterized protein n=1 Tax=Hymenoscyphus albidus TaxID=595503 RepID=A0A9N9LM13_9HELO|nr:hypothetical protein HYALB_00009501 [Hymenoscyphus albidus]
MVHSPSIIRCAIAIIPRDVKFCIAEGTNESRRWGVLCEMGSAVGYPFLVEFRSKLHLAAQEGKLAGQVIAAIIVAHRIGFSGALDREEALSASVFEKTDDAVVEAEDLLLTEEAEEVGWVLAAG